MKVYYVVFLSLSVMWQHNSLLLLSSLWLSWALILHMRDVKAINCLKTREWKQSSTRISVGCQAVQNSPPIRAEVLQRVSKWSWMGKWEKDVHSVQEIDKFKDGRHKSGNRKAMIHKKMRTGCVNSKCLHYFIHILIASYRSVTVFFLRNYDLCSPLYARMSVHISILTLPFSLLRESNHSSITPQHCRYKLSQIAGDQ